MACTFEVRCAPVEVTRLEPPAHSRSCRAVALLFDVKRCQRGEVVTASAGDGCPAGQANGGHQKLARQSHSPSPSAGKGGDRGVWGS